MASESSIERSCKSYAEKQGWLLLKLWPIIAGIPDRILLRPGGTIDFIEFKKPGLPLTKIQKWWFGRLQGLGFRCWRMDNRAEFVEKFQ